MSEGNVIRGNFGREPGQPAKTDVIRPTEPTENGLSSEERVRLVFQTIVGYDNLKARLLGSLSLEEQAEIKRRLKQIKK